MRWMLLGMLVAGAIGVGGSGCHRTAGAAADREDTPADGYVVARDKAAAGEYLTSIGGCNDCHTPGWMETNGAVPDDDRLVGSAMGWRGPWGTTYPANLRLSVAGKPAATWIAMIRSRTDMPPMPWMSLHRMPDRDLAAIHAYLTKLGPKGTPAPAWVPPDQEPSTPFLSLEPVFPKGP